METFDLENIIRNSALGNGSTAHKILFVLNFYLAQIFLAAIWNYLKVISMVTDVQVYTILLQYCINMVLTLDQIVIL